MSGRLLRPARSSVCETVLEGCDELPLAEHEPGEAVTEDEVKPTCTEPGSHDTVVYCTVCEKELSRETVTDPALGHTPEDVEEVPAEIGKPGTTAGVKCAVCGEILEGCEAIEALEEEKSLVKKVSSNQLMRSVGSYNVDIDAYMYTTNDNPFYAKGLYGQCTWYCWGRAVEKCEVCLWWNNGTFGNAIDWYDNASYALSVGDGSLNYYCDTVPSANSIMVSPSGWTDTGVQVGHVMFVEAVDGDYAYITEANYAGNVYHEDVIQLSTGRRNWGSGSYLTITGFIHLGSTSTPPSPTVTFEPWEQEGYTYIDRTSASIGQTITVTDGTCTKVGFELSTASGASLGGAYNNSYENAKNYFVIGKNQEVNVELTPGTTYHYQFYAVVPDICSGYSGDLRNKRQQRILDMHGLRKNLCRLRRDNGDHDCRADDPRYRCACMGRVDLSELGGRRRPTALAHLHGLRRNGVTVCL